MCPDMPRKVRWSGNIGPYITLSTRGKRVVKCTVLPLRPGKWIALLAAEVSEWVTGPASGSEDKSFTTAEDQTVDVQPVIWSLY
jgi:hypothetical protein